MVMLPRYNTNCKQPTELQTAKNLRTADHASARRREARLGAVERAQRSAVLRGGLKLVSEREW
eukprot:361103-Chlamydomonas_euryale.AAC.1